MSEIKPDSTSVEKTSLEQLFSRLEETEGFDQLTPKQQQIIKTSLILQKRSEREASENEYDASQTHIAIWNCHAAIANLETEGTQFTKFPQLPKSFFENDYQSINTLDDLKKMLTQHGFPCVAQISYSGDSINQNILDYRHSFLVLGPDQQGKILVWDKKGYKQTYRVTDVDEIFKEYHGDTTGNFWGARDLMK